MSQLRIALGAAAPPDPLKISWPVQLAAIASLSFYLHSVMWWTEPRDIAGFLRPWFDHIVRYGPIGAFAHPFSNYTPTYLYLLSAASLSHQLIEPMYAIKLLSVAGNAFAALAVADLIKACGGRHRYAALLFIIPSFVINAALLAQCDALWAGACVFAVAAMIRGRTLSSLAWCGVAIAFKAQSAFVAPFIIGALIGRREPLWKWVVPAIVFIGLMAPAWLAGWPASKLAMIYPGQAAWGDMPSRLANPWMFATVFAPRSAGQFYWIGFAGVALASVTIAASTSSVRNPRAMLQLALLASLVLPFLFPKMLERYYFLAGLLSVAAAISYPRWSTIALAAAIEIASGLSLLTYMYFYAQPYLTLIGVPFAGAAIAGAYLLARRNVAEWPTLNAVAAPPPPASAERIAA